MAKAYLTLLQDNFCMQDHLFVKTTAILSLQVGIPVLMTYHLIIVTRSQITNNDC